MAPQPTPTSSPSHLNLSLPLPCPPNTDRLRVTPELLTCHSHGRTTAKRLKGLSRSEEWGPVVRGAAARLLRAWRTTVNDGGSMGGTPAACMPGTSVAPSEDRTDGRGEGKGAVRTVATAAAAALSERSAQATGTPQDEKEEEEEEKEKDKGDNSSRKTKPPTAMILLSSGARDDTDTAVAVAPRPAASLHPPKGRASRPQPQPQPQPRLQQPPKPKRPSLVPAVLWDRLSQEFNASQLNAIWAAAASQLEARHERTRAAAATTPTVKAAAATTTATTPARVEAAAVVVAAEGYRAVGGGIVLLQGPPGTGKTRTILGVVSAILARREEKGVGGTGVSAAGDRCSGDGDGERGMGTTLGVGARRKRPGVGVAGRWVAAKTHQRVSGCGARGSVAFGGFCCRFCGCGGASGDISGGIYLIVFVAAVFRGSCCCAALVHFQLPRLTLTSLLLASRCSFAPLATAP